MLELLIAWRLDGSAYYGYICYSMNRLLDLLGRSLAEQKDVCSFSLSAPLTLSLFSDGAKRE